MDPHMFDDMFKGLLMVGAVVLLLAVGVGVLIGVLL